jgi:hypothetical protein
MHLGQQMRQQGDVAGVGHANDKAALCLRRIEHRR